MTVAHQIEELAATFPDPVRGAELQPLRDRLDSAAERAVALLEGHSAEGALPLRLPKGRVLDLLTCERLAVARHAGGDHTEAAPVALLRGQAMDRFVQHELHGGPVADPLEDLLAMVEAEGDLDLHHELSAAGDALQLGPLATAARDWAGTDPAWWPRTQSAAAVHLADGLVRCEGRIDVELGGPLTGRPSVVVEVKVGRPHSSHLAEATHYSLLVALRDGVAPALLGRWYPGSSLAHQVVTFDTLDSAARRLADMIVTWAQLQAGRPAAERPGPGCGWCPDADRCGSFRPPPDPFEVDPMGEGVT
ncbi:MAG: hypothetical protein ACOYOP_12045 [Microthrixaceae bacterium]